MRTAIFEAPPKMVLNEAGETVEVILSLKDYELFLDLLEEEHYAELARERAGQPSRPWSEFMAERGQKLQNP